MIILQYAAFLLPNIKICDYLHHVIRSILDTVYYHDCGSNLYPGIFNCNSSKLL